MHSGLFAGLGLLAAGCLGAIAISRSRGRRGALGDAGTEDTYDPRQYDETPAANEYDNSDEDDPYRFRNDDKESGCLILGGYHPRHSTGPYRLCLTSNQEKTLFGGKRAKQKKLGCGVFACAYTAPGSTRVVKFTRDSEDVAALMKAQKSGVVPKIHAVYKLAQPGRTMPQRDPFTFRMAEAQDVPVYALVTERLRTIPKDERDMVNDSIIPVGDVGRGDITGNDFCDQQVGDDGNTGCDDMQMKVIAAAEKLHKAGIKWGDIHAGNIGFDKRGKLKVLDLGLTSTQLKRRLKVLKGLGLKAPQIEGVRLLAKR